MSNASALWLAVWGLLAFGGSPSPHAEALRAVANAQGPKDEAKTKFDEGERAFEQGDYQAAEAAFREANELVPHPNTAYNLGLTLEQAGQLGEAWMVFHQLAEGATDPAVQRDASRRLRQLETRVAVIHLRAQPVARLCVDGHPAHYRPDQDYLEAVTAGSHTIVMDEEHLALDLESGRHYVLELTSRPARPGRPALVPGLLAGSSAAGVLAVGLGAGALTHRDDSARTGLTAGSVSSAVVGTGLAVAALAVYVHQRRAARSDRARLAPPIAPTAPTNWDCPVKRHHAE